MAPASARARRTLVALQFGLALVLLIGAGLLMRSFIRAADIDVGFQPAGLYAMRIVPPGRANQQQAAALYERLMGAMRASPGVRGAAFINHAPFLGASIPTTLVVDGRLSADSSSQLFYRTASSSYRDVMRLTMGEGRWFDDADERAASAVFVINETAARRYWPGTSPLGARVRIMRSYQGAKDFGTFVSGTIIGVVRDVHQVSQDITPAAEVYVPYTFEPWGWGSLIVRVDASAVPHLRDVVRSVDSRLVSDADKTPFSSMNDAISSSLQPRVLAIRFIGAFALVGLALASLGLYGVIAYSVAQRTREIAVRKAIGATNGNVIRLVVSDSAAMLAIGGVIGAPAAFASTRWLSSLLFETSPLDPVVYILAAATLVSVALAATVLPARRATRLDPAIALRQE
jgi:predicted permease